MSKVEIKLPAIVFADDYHEFPFQQDLLRSLVAKDSRRLKVYDLGLDENTAKYVGLVYFGERPKKEDIEVLLKEKKVSMLKVY